jgi:hypothetical protein
MPTLSFHSLELLVIAHQARNRALLDGQRPNALTLDSIVAIVTAAASTEAFINEFAEHIAIFRAASLEGLTPSMVTCSDAIAELEESKAPVTVKYLIASQILGAAFARDAAPYQDFAMLIQLRNAIMHAKPATNESSHQGTKVTDVLAQRGIATRLEPGVKFAWFNRLEVPGVARWACTSAHSIILGIVDRLPPSPPNTGGNLEWLDRAFRNHVAFQEPS